MENKTIIPSAKYGRGRKNATIGEPNYCRKMLYFILLVTKGQCDCHYDMLFTT
jgi:hypothetical protein